MSAIDKQHVEAALRALAEQHGGRLTPEAVVEAARSEASPLHPFFTWDDARAAEQHRIDQARALIRTVRVVIHTETREVEAPFFVRDPDAAARSQGYVSLPRLKTERDAARAAITAEFARAAAALHRARSIAAYLDLTNEVATLADRLDVLRATVANEAGAAAGPAS